MRKYRKEILKPIIVVALLFSMISCSPSIIYQPPVNDPLVLTGSGNESLSILTYNIQTVFGKDENKLDALLDYIDRERFDFVLFQELFDEAARNYIRKNLNTGTYKCVVTRIDYESFPELLFQDSGLYLMSRYPQINLSGIGFNDQVSVSEGAVHMILNKEVSLSTDFLANKSVMGSLHQISDSTYLFLFTTHLQALGSKRHKRRQYRQIRDFIGYTVHTVLGSGTVESPQNMIVILTGDFNSDAYDQDDLETLLSNLGSPRDLHSEFNPGHKEYTMRFKLFNMYKRFDYIFAYDRIGSVPLRSVSIQSINATDVQNAENASISDHLALKASVSLDEPAAATAYYRSGERSAK